MIQRILEQEKAIYEVLKDDRKTSKLILDDETLDVLHAVVDGLEKVATLTDLLSGKRGIVQYKNIYSHKF